MGQDTCHLFPWRICLRRFMELGLQEDRQIRPIKNKAVTYIVFLPKLFNL